MKKNHYLYPAIFDYGDDGINVTFPNLPGCITFGSTDEEAFSMAKEAMALHLYGLEKEQSVIPVPTVPKNIVTNTNQAIVIINAWMPPFRHEMENQSIKKTLTIPKWLDDVAKENKVNYSHLLQDAIKEHVGIYKVKKK